MNARISDQIIDRDYRVFGALQGRHAALNQRGERLGSYPMAKAQCWMDVAFHEYTRNDRSAFPQGALGEAERIIAALEKRMAAPTDTPLVNGAARLREDLWARARALSGGAGASCAAASVACAEVELVHAGNEFNQGGWRYANPYIRIAEDRLERAAAEAAACPAAAPVAQPAPVVVPPPKPVPPVAPIAAPPAPAPVERVVLMADGLFAFDRGDLGGLSGDGRRHLDQTVARLKAIAPLTSISIVGHTDRLGSPAYNGPLSMARATTVRDYLAAAGLPAQVMRVEGRGAADPVALCTEIRDRRALIACLAPNRRVVIEAVGTRATPSPRP